MEDMWCPTSDCWIRAYKTVASTDEFAESEEITIDEYVFDVLQFMVVVTDGKMTINEAMNFWFLRILMPEYHDKDLACCVMHTFSGPNEKSTPCVGIAGLRRMYVLMTEFFPALLNEDYRSDLNKAFEDRAAKPLVVPHDDGELECMPVKEVQIQQGSRAMLHFTDVDGKKYTESSFRALKASMDEEKAREIAEMKSKLDAMTNERDALQSKVNELEMDQERKRKKKAGGVTVGNILEELGVDMPQYEVFCRNVIQNVKLLHPSLTTFERDSRVHFFLEDKAKVLDVVRNVCC